MQSELFGSCEAHISISPATSSLTPVHPRLSDFCTNMAAASCQHSCWQPLRVCKPALRHSTARGICSHTLKQTTDAGFGRLRSHRVYASGEQQSGSSQTDTSSQLQSKQARQAGMHWSGSTLSSRLETFQACRKLQASQRSAVSPLRSLHKRTMTIFSLCAFSSMLLEG